MKTKLFATVALCAAISANAQKPFKEIGKDNEVNLLTLSNGRYVEYFTYDTLRQIGSVMFNTKTHKVEYFITEDDTDQQHILARANEASRFMSIDPLTSQFPELTPYQFASNTPIRGVDLDGEELADLVYLEAKYLFGNTMLNVPSVVDVSEEIYNQFGIGPQTENMVNYVKKCATEPNYYINQLTLVGVFEGYKKETSVIYEGIKNNDPKAYVKAASLVINVYLMVEGITKSFNSKPISNSSAYDIAKQGGKHSGFIANNVGRSIKEIDNGIKSLSKGIEVHKNKIANPEKYVKDFYEKPAQYQQNIINNWAEEIINYSEQKQILETTVKEKKKK